MYLLLDEIAREFQGHITIDEGSLESNGTVKFIVRIFGIPLIPVVVAKATDLEQGKAQLLLELHG